MCDLCETPEKDAAHRRWSAEIARRAIAQHRAMQAAPTPLEQIPPAFRRRRVGAAGDSAVQHLA